MAFAWKPYLDPLTGFGLRGYIGYVGFQAVLAGAIALAFSWRRRWLGSGLAAFTVFMALPLPSKRGIDLRVENATSEPAQVIVVREDTTSRSISISIAPGQMVHYRTAPGDYSENIPFAIEHRKSRLTVTAGELRQHQVRLTDKGISLEVGL